MKENEFDYIFNKYDKDEVFSTLKRMNNYPSIDKKNHYLYDALKEWLQTNFDNRK